jgi:hypothetical protein
MVHRGNTREPKRIRNVRMSTLEDKLRRHKNKRRIWRRCVATIAKKINYFPAREDRDEVSEIHLSERAQEESFAYEAASLEAAS